MLKFKSTLGSMLQVSHSMAIYISKSLAHFSLVFFSFFSLWLWALILCTETMEFVLTSFHFISTLNRKSDFQNSDKIESEHDEKSSAFHCIFLLFLWKILRLVAGVHRRNAIIFGWNDSNRGKLFWNEILIMALHLHFNALEMWIAVWSSKKLWIWNSLWRKKQSIFTRWTNS